jgi:hypothetical protein
MVELTHRATVQAAAAADLRHRPRDELAKVRVLQQFRLGGGRVAEPDTEVEVPRYLVSDLIARGLATKV